MMRLLRRLAHLARFTRHDDDLANELEFHRRMVERDLVAGGVPPAQARDQSRRAVGNPTYLREEARRVWMWPSLDTIAQDLRFASRVLRRNVGFSAAVILTLALGIGANTAIFSVVHAVLLEPLPYAEPERLYSLWNVPEKSPAERQPVSYLGLRDWQASATSFSGIGGYAFNRYELAGPDGVDVLRAIMGTPGLYGVLGARPALGRLPRADEERVPVVAISHRVWKRRFGADPAVIGRTVSLDEQPYTVVGVMEAGFHFPAPDVDLWMSMYPLFTNGPEASNPWLTSRGLRGYRTVGRLKPNVSPAAAESEMNAIAQRIGEQYPDMDGGTRVALQSIRDDTVQGVRRALWLTLGAAGLVLLLGCVNVGHLMLARTSVRAREIAVRRALGAHRGRIFRQLLTESVVLGVLGGLIGLALADIGTKVFVRFGPGDMPRIENVSLDPMTLAFAASISLATAVLFGIAPATSAWAGGLSDALRAQAKGAVGNRGGRRTRALLTVAEVAFAFLLLVAAGLTVRSLASLLTTDMGFRPDHVITMQVSFARTRYPDAADRVKVLDRVLDRVQTVAGVELVGASTSMPPARMQQGLGFIIDGDPAPLPNREPRAIFVPMTPEFLRTLGVPLMSGRFFRPSDDAAAPKVALISETLAKRDFRGRNPIGRRVRVGDSLHTIVGIVGDVGYEGIGKPAGPTLYVPFAQSPWGGAWIAVRASADAPSLIAPIRAAIHEVDPLMNARELQPMSELVSSVLARPRFQTWLLATFGGLAIVLAAIGIYGVIGYGVAQRTSEIGLRLALGASQSRILGGIVSNGMMPVLIGLGIGFAGAMTLSRVMVGLLYGVSATDTLTLAAVTVVLGTVALVAAYLPARRAAKLDPLTALREG